MDGNDVSVDGVTAPVQPTEQLSWAGSEFEVLWRSDAGPLCDVIIQPDGVAGADEAGPAAGVSLEMVSSLLSSGSLECDLDAEALQRQLRRVLLQNLQLRDAVRRSSSSLRQQCHLLAEWRADNDRLRAERRQVAGHCQRARNVVTQLRSQNATLRERQELLSLQLSQQQQAEQLPTAADVELELRSQLSRSEEQLRDIRLEVERLRSKLERQRAELVACRAGPERSNSPERHLRLQNQYLLRQLSEERQLSDRQRAEVETGRALQECQSRLTEAATSVGRLRQEAAAAPVDRAALATQLEALQAALLSGAPPPELAAADRQRQQVDMDAMQARIVSMEELLSARGTECERLQRQLLQTRRELQAIDILKAQVDVYQQDFNQERRQRDQLATEREQLVTEREQLRGQVQQLEAQCRQLQLACAGGGGSLPRTPSGLSSVAAAAQWTVLEPEPERRPELYTCPKCQMAFLDVQPLQSHVNRCLDEDE